MLLLSRKDILSVFSMKDAIEVDKKAFVAHSQGLAQVPLRINLDNDKKDGKISFMGLTGLGVTLALQFAARRYKPVFYWLAVVAVSIFGTMYLLDSLFGINGLVSALLAGESCGAVFAFMLLARWRRNKLSRKTA